MNLQYFRGAWRSLSGRSAGFIPQERGQHEACPEDSKDSLAEQRPCGLKSALRTAGVPARSDSASIKAPQNFARLGRFAAAADEDVRAPKTDSHSDCSVPGLLRIL